MSSYEKLIEILEKNNISHEEENYINLLCAEDIEARKIFSIYNNLKTSRQKSFKVTDELLADYVLYINGIEPENKSVISLIPEIEKQIRASEKLKNEFEILNAEYSEADNFITQTFSKQTHVKLQQHTFYNRFKAPIYSASAFVLIYVILFTAFNIFAPGYKKNILLYDNSDKSYSRGRVSESFQQSLIYINNKDYKTAAELLNKDIAENPESKTIFYSHYILGLIYLQNSESNILGLVKIYNGEELKKGIEQLEIAVNKNRGSQFKNINLNAYFFIANAYLALDNIKKAKSYLELVRSGKGGYMRNAEELLDSFASKR